MPVEYEHRYLVERIPTLDTNPKYITQLYIAYDKDRKCVQRIRMTCTNDEPPKYEVTHKIGTGRILREVEYEISPEDFHELKTFFRIGYIIEKIRHCVEIDGLVWDVDVYENGMITAEIENPPEAYSMEGFGKTYNLTGVFEFSNYKISEKGYPEYKHLL